MLSLARMRSIPHQDVMVRGMMAKASKKKKKNQAKSMESKMLDFPSSNEDNELTAFENWSDDEDADSNKRGGIYRWKRFMQRDGNMEPDKGPWTGMKTWQDVNQAELDKGWDFFKKVEYQEPIRYVYNLDKKNFEGAPAVVKAAYDVRNGSAHDMLSAKKAVTAKTFQYREYDTGSPAVQIANMTLTIAHLTDHINAGNRKDYSAKRGLLRLVSRRKAMLKYLREYDFTSYKAVVRGMKLRAR